MRIVRWTNEAIATLPSLSADEQRSLLSRLDLVAQFPAMYPARQRGRFTGLRYLVIGKRWLVYYRPGEKELLVLAIVPALARPI